MGKHVRPLETCQLTISQEAREHGHRCNYKCTQLGNKRWICRRVKVTVKNSACFLGQLRVWILKFKSDFVDWALIFILRNLRIFRLTSEFYEKIKFLWLFVIIFTFGSEIWVQGEVGILRLKFAEKITIFSIHILSKNVSVLRGKLTFLMRRKSEFYWKCLISHIFVKLRTPRNISQWP